MHPLRDLVRRHKQAAPVGITAVCSAHRLVIEATLVHAMRRDQPFVLIEATSNQVNQDGGYTGMTPAQFHGFVTGIAAEVGFPAGRLVLGGDHLGPNPWSALDSGAAMDKAETMVADYVRAGFSKIHLDCSMSCAGDPEILPPPVIAARAARLCNAAEHAASGRPQDDRPVYVIGTEVPVPGGATEDLAQLGVTSPEAALATIDMHRDLFLQAGLNDAWNRVVAIVVQPGVEFDHDKVVAYDPRKATGLSASIVPTSLVFEAHSTDYQTQAALTALVRDHFAILKVGPGVTFALREALWALDAIERELIDEGARADLRKTVLARMRADPKHWRRYYHATGRALDMQMQYSLSDRIRYYWPDPQIAAAEARLFDNLRHTPPPWPLLSQYMPLALAALRAQDRQTDPRELVIAHIGTVLDAYHGACTHHD
jgi:D-tagatose-1,6-bisphosphate aldolase subunit GatZ/KbaZ